jgi:hypothetical protein
MRRPAPRKDAGVSDSPSLFAEAPQPPRRGSAPLVCAPAPVVAARVLPVEIKFPRVRPAQDPRTGGRPGRLPPSTSEAGFPPRPGEVCVACAMARFDVRPDGSWVCLVCH